MFLPTDCVRGRVRGFVQKHVRNLGHRVIEVGARMPEGSDPAWANNRTLAPPETSWVGVDIQAGPGVDQVADAEFLPFADNEFTGGVCSEMLEHVMDPQKVLAEMSRVLQVGATIIVTTLTAFPIHGYPDDYWRFTPNGLKLLMERAGFTSVYVESAGAVNFALNDHGEAGLTHRECPIHVFGTGIRK